jgi:hypothetical protein
VRLGIKLPHHAYLLPECVELTAAVRCARIQGGKLCVVTEREVMIPIVFEGKTYGATMTECVFTELPEGKPKKGK